MSHARRGRCRTPIGAMSHAHRGDVARRRGAMSHGRLRLRRPHKGPMSYIFRGRCAPMLCRHGSRRRPQIHLHARRRGGGSAASRRPGLGRRAGPRHARGRIRRVSRRGPPPAGRRHGVEGALPRRRAGRRQQALRPALDRVPVHRGPRHGPTHPRVHRHVAGSTDPQRRDGSGRRAALDAGRGGLQRRRALDGDRRGIPPGAGAVGAGAARPGAAAAAVLSTH